MSGWPLTDKAEDVSDGRDEDDQHVVEGQDGGSDQHVSGPAELAAAEQQRCDGGADLAGRQEQGGNTRLNFIHPKTQVILLQFPQTAIAKSECFKLAPKLSLL